MFCFELVKLKNEHTNNKIVNKKERQKEESRKGLCKTDNRIETKQIEREGETAAKTTILHLIKTTMETPLSNYNYYFRFLFVYLLKKRSKINTSLKTQPPMSQIIRMF